MSALFDQLVRRIQLDGPLSLADYMAQVLTDPHLGYYSRQQADGKDPFGRRGDFITAPEISQMFGELLGLWCADCWVNLGAPPRVILAELGPGRGTLMADLLRAAKGVPAFLAALEIHLVEVSPSLRRRQAQALGDLEVTWHDSVDQLPTSAPLLLLANEFFDALPIHQYQRTRQGWAERRIGINDAGTELVFGLAAAVPGNRLLGLPPADIGAVAELCPAGNAIAQAIGQRLAAQGGAALIVDYGYLKTQAGDSLQALRAHRYHPVLRDPGSADITAHVNFQALAEAAQAGGARPLPPVTQGDFLTHLGLDQRASQLIAQATASQAKDIAEARKRLTGDAEMGRLFKVLALTTSDGPDLAGFPTSQDPGETQATPKNNPG
jgi:NADH dehydrogenase [ubiquinone] 1 alpha subcomplex assembly factor 7